ncbi:hypothetical protein QVD17_08395 [Tagetes erecta]|uniref:Uncharacterized protein n=1 Tax=Tagetes erecta TaxID=13708 RepID=A0AAD8KZ20_TARER|nr:hypothetical protein QVD17_08395 [Tagetes erecta]
MESIIVGQFRNLVQKHTNYFSSFFIQTEIIDDSLSSIATLTIPSLPFYLLILPGNWGNETILIQNHGLSTAIRKSRLRLFFNNATQIYLLVKNRLPVDH